MAGLLKQELALNQPLLASGDVSRTDVLRLQRQLADLQSQITNKRNKYFQDAQAELGKVQEELAGVEQMLAQRKNQLEQTELRAPLRGVVKNVRITTRGGVIRPGEEVMQIVPLEDDLVIEAKVSPADIAFLKRGLDATVKIDAYDYTVYGDLPGTLTYISADTLNEDLKQNELPYYRVQVKAKGRQFSGRPNEVLEIQPGMTATVEIKTGSNTVLQYLAKPVVKTLSESLGER
jgi:adhesin transport system membrane fusion protein